MSPLHTISTKQALRLAFWTIKLPSAMCFFGPLVLLLFWMNSPASFGRGAGLEWAIAAALAGALLLGFLLSWAVWSIGVPRWRLWAYSRVDDVSALKRDAVAAQLLWPQGHPFEKTEIASARLRRRLAELELERLKPPNNSLERSRDR